MSAIDYDVLLYGRNEAPFIPRTLMSLYNQHHPPRRIYYVDDNSSDDSEIKLSVTQWMMEMMEYHPRTELIYLVKHWKHPNLRGLPELSRIANETIKLMYAHPPLPQFFMQGGADMTYPSAYMTELLERFLTDPKLMIASGYIANDRVEFNPRWSRGTGRVYRMSFWDKWIKRHPETYVWESYPVYKAISLGLHVRQFKEIPCSCQRVTKNYNRMYGRAWRQLGYLPMFALAKCFLEILKHGRGGIELTANYLSKTEIYDSCMIKPLRQLQKWRMSEKISHILKVKR
jgi:hypothetical protein